MNFFLFLPLLPHSQTSLRLLRVLLLSACSVLSVLSGFLLMQTLASVSEDNMLQIWRPVGGRWKSMTSESNVLLWLRLPRKTRVGCFASVRIFILPISLSRSLYLGHYLALSIPISACRSLYLRLSTSPRCIFIFLSRPVYLSQRKCLGHTRCFPLSSSLSLPLFAFQTRKAFKQEALSSFTDSDDDDEFDGSVNSLEDF